MSRRCDERIDVRLTHEVVRWCEGEPLAGVADRPVPDRFVWRGRFYLVHEVMSCWRERQAWWKHSLLHESHCQIGDLEVKKENVALLAVLADGADRTVWRVRASAGVSAPVGVYDLAMDALAEAGGGAHQTASRRTVGGRGDHDGGDVPGTGTGLWRLVRVSD